jgi:pimeloyl-ACP methyl ester carboxylesterase
MPRMSIKGVGIEYELLGEPEAPAVALTPGGRFSMETPGLRELGKALAAGGKRVLLWDRPNCGLSDVCFEAEAESILQGETLMALIRALDLGPIALAAGSAGSRVSLIAASRDPAPVSHLLLWWISGGNIGLMSLANFYCAEPANLVGVGGMEAVTNASCWAEQTRRNPAARAALLAMDPDHFVEVMQKWSLAYTPSQVSPVPGMSTEDWKTLTMPVLLFRNGRKDVSHSRATSDWVHRLIPHSQMIDPPWPEDEWNISRVQRMKGEAAGPFVSWPLVAPFILDFTRRQ